MILCPPPSLPSARPSMATNWSKKVGSPPGQHENAHSKNEITFNKPISCHLYPIRVKEYSEFTAVNYHNWSICSDACSLGDELKKPVFEFVKEALIKKFGNEWFSELEKIAKNKIE